MKLNEDNVFAFLDRTLTNFNDVRHDKQALGFRLRSLSIASPLTDSTDVDELRYSGVMIKANDPWETRTFPHLSQQAYLDKVDEMKAQGFGPHLLSATGPSGDQIYAAVFRKSGRFPLSKTDMSADEFADENIKQKDNGRILISADAFGSPFDFLGNSPRYCAIWDRNDDRVAWSDAVLDLAGKERQQMFDAMTSARARPAIHAITPTGGTMTIYVDSRSGSWRSKQELLIDQMRAKIVEEREAKRFLVGVTAFGTGNNAQFSGIWDSSDTTQARRFRKDGQTLNPLAVPHPIDTAMRNFMDRQNLRGAAVAVVRDSKLIFAHGYSLAESDYPAITAETLFRQASVSKTFTAVAIWRLIQLGRLDIDDDLVNVLQLKQRNGEPPADKLFEKITVRQLLESRSGIDQFSLRKALTERRDSSASQPATAKYVESWIAEQDLVGFPGATKSTSYGKTDYFLLGQIVKSLTGADSYFAGLKSLVLDPLEMTRTRLGRSKREDQASNEAPYHLSAHTRDKDGNLDTKHLSTGISMVHADRRKVAYQYGAQNIELFGPTGGISASVIDVARLCALLSSRDPNQPLLSPSTINDMLERAASATKKPIELKAKFPDLELSNHGYHGFEAVKVKERNAAKIITKFSARKGGSLSGVRTHFKTEDGKTWFIMAYNGDPGDPPNNDWFNVMKKAVADAKLSNADRFPSFGMSSIAIDTFS